MQTDTSIAEKLSGYSPSCFDMLFFAASELREKLGDHTLVEVIDAIDAFMTDDLGPDWDSDRERESYARAWAAFHGEPLAVGLAATGVTDDEVTGTIPQVEWIEREIGPCGEPIYCVETSDGAFRIHGEQSIAGVAELARTFAESLEGSDASAPVEIKATYEDGSERVISDLRARRQDGTVTLGEMIASHEAEQARHKELSTDELKSIIADQQIGEPDVRTLLYAAAELASRA